MMILIKKMVLIFVFLLFSVCFWPCVHGRSHNESLINVETFSYYMINGETFSFYKLALTWPNAFCKGKAQKCSIPIQQYFTIHGLWPQFKNDTPVPPFDQYSGCTAVPQPTTEIDLLKMLSSILTANLDNFWPNLINKATNPEFWKTEWTKHGRCSAYPVQPEKYFQLALDKRGEYDLMKILNDSGIVPSLKTFTPRNIRNVIQAKTGFFPQVHCNKEGKSKTIQLLELRLCVDGTTEKFRDCPNVVSGECKLDDDIIFTPK